MELSDNNGTISYNNNQYHAVEISTSIPSEKVVCQDGKNLDKVLSDIDNEFKEIDGNLGDKAKKITLITDEMISIESELTECVHETTFDSFKSDYKKDKNRNENLFLGILIGILLLLLLDIYLIIEVRIQSSRMDNLLRIKSIKYEITTDEYMQKKLDDM